MAQDTWSWTWCALQLIAAALPPHFFCGLQGLRRGVLFALLFALACHTSCMIQKPGFGALHAVQLRHLQSSLCRARQRHSTRHDQQAQRSCAVSRPCRCRWLRVTGSSCFDTT
jgi:hypothetical protein